MKNNIKFLTQTEIQSVYGGTPKHSHTLIVTNTPDYYKNFTPPKITLNSGDYLVYTYTDIYPKDTVTVVKHSQF